MSDYESQIQELLEQATELGQTQAQVLVLQEAVRLSDLHGNQQYQFYTRQKLIDAATFTGRQDLALVAFSWCLAKCQQSPEEFDIHDILWQYKWIVNGLHHFPQFPLTQIQQLMSEMEDTYRKAGSNCSVIHHKQCELGMAIGNREMAQEAYNKLKTSERDFLSDCYACELDVLVEYQLFLGDEVAAIQSAQPLLSKKHSCAEVPHRTYSRVILPLLKNGQVKLSLEYQQIGYRMIKSNPEFIKYWGDHLVVLALTGNWEQAVKILEQKWPTVEIATDPLSQLAFFAKAHFLSAGLVDHYPMKTIQIPTGLEIKKLQGRGTAADCASYFQTATLNLVEKFDQRNGNQYYRTRFLEQKRLWQFAEFNESPKKK